MGRLAVTVYIGLFMGVQSQKYKKNGSKVPNFGADTGAKKVEIQIFSPELRLR